MKDAHSSVLKDNSHFISLSLGKYALSLSSVWIPSGKLRLHKKASLGLPFYMSIGTYTTLPNNFFNLPLGWYLAVTTPCTNVVHSLSSVKLNLGGSTSVTGAVGPYSAENW